MQKEKEIIEPTDFLVKNSTGYVEISNINKKRIERMKRDKSHTRSAMSRASAMTKASSQSEQSVIGPNALTPMGIFAKKMKSASTGRKYKYRDSQQNAIVKQLFAQYPVRESYEQNGLTSKQNSVQHLKIVQSNTELTQTT